MKFWESIPYAAAVLAVQAQPPPMAAVSGPSQAPASSTSIPLYRVVVVQGSAKAINYRNLKSSTKIDLKGTVLSPEASGVASVESEHGGIEITVKIKKLPPALTFGDEFLTYVLWGISPEGRATNLGEILLKHGKGKVKVMEQLQTFGLVVTAEPYFAVSQPSDAVVLENAVRKDAQGQVELIDAKYELLKRGQYTLNLAPREPMVMDEKTPFAVYQARNAVRIAQAAGAAIYAPEAFGKAQNYLKKAETVEGGEKGRVMMAREAVQRAEDARLIAVQRQEAEEVALERKQAQDKLDDAKREAAAATTAQNAAIEQAQQAQNENEGLRSRNENLQAKNEGLRSALMDQLNAILETRATARGLIVNMSGVLFQNGKSTLLPAAREKLSKIAGILSTHKGLNVEADGFTDSTGSDAFNMRLSRERARATKDYLVAQGVPADSISFQGFGKKDPIASNETNAGRQENRRVELVVSGEGITAP